MKIGLYTNTSYMQNSVKNNSKNIAFGEIDGDYFDYVPRMSKSQYEAKKDAINEKYDSKRGSYLSDADDLEFDNSVVWQQLKRIEQMRECELRDLESEYR